VRTATLIALISSLLVALNEMLLLIIGVFHLPVDDYRILRTFDLGSRCLLILLTGSLSYFFWLFYNRMTSRRPKPVKKPSSIA